MTNANLHQFHNEIQSWNGSVLSEFNRQKIKDFYKHNGAKIDTLTKKMQDLTREYFEVENDSVKLNEEKKPVLLEDKTMEGYTREFTELMGRSIEIKI